MSRESPFAYHGRVLRLFGNHDLRSAYERVAHLFRTIGPVGTFNIFLNTFDEQYLRTFDRAYGIQTSGYVELSNTSFDRSRLKDATQYKPVSGWGLRKLLRQLKFPQEFHFVDLGCGLGRACILGADYGFQRVTGVDLAPELCRAARENVQKWKRRSGDKARINILETDALVYSATTDADVIFMFRPFSLGLLESVVQALAERATVTDRKLTIIYSERMMLPGSYSKKLSALPFLRPISTYGLHGQAFYIYECGKV